MIGMRDTPGDSIHMQMLMSPFRFAGLWALFPVLLVCAALVGAAAGGLSGWAVTRSVPDEPQVLQLAASPVIWMVATVLMGLATNSWAISTMLGATTMIAATVTHSVARGMLLESATVDHVEIAGELPVAILAGASLGWAGCLWRHERGWFRILGSVVIAGALLAVAWPELEPEGFTFSLDYLVGWVAIGLAIIVVLRAGGIGAIAMAIIGAGIVAVGVVMVTGDATLTQGTFLSDLWHESSRRSREFLGVP